MESVESLFEEHKNLIQKTMWRNHLLLSALHLEDEDVAQQLAITLLLAIRRFDPDRSESLTAYLRYSLQYEILNIKRRFKPHGITGVPKGHRVDFLYLDNVLTGDRAYELPSDDDISSFEVSELFEHLTAKETEAVRLKVYGFPVRRKVHTAALAGVGRRYEELYAVN